MRSRLAAACLTACAGGPAPAPVETVTATIPAPTATVTEKAPETDPPQETSSPAKAATDKKRLPNVVGMNLQAGQDTLQAADFYVLNDKDATGQNRLQIFDRNWVITRQSPAAGRMVSTDTLITLYAKKIGE